ncbi:MAG: ankyrin repeat domain-containing protein [Bryobacterales bacterium]|nr:ankyrin repeat domain-containing protein [Bryobacterales bacterium]
MTRGFKAYSFTLALAVAALAATPSPVADAAAKGDRASVRSLIQQKADVNAPQPDGATAVQWAAYRNDLELADIVIAAGANVKLANRDGATPLSLASLNGNAPMIEKLLKAGADPNERGPKGELPLLFASRNGNVDAMRVLLDHKADINAKETLRGTTALMWAAEQGHAAAVKYLLQRGADLSAASNPDSKGNTAYLAPTQSDRSRSAFARGGLADALNSTGQQGQGRGGAQAAAGAGRGRGGRGAGGRGAASAAAGGDAGDIDVVAAADQAAADFAFGRTQNTDGGGLTPLIFATREAHLDCVQALVDAGADVNQTSRYGWTPLLVATQNRHYQIGKYLLEHGANPNIPNKGGWTPLYLATDNRNIEGGDYPVRSADMDQMEFIKLLIDKGADVNARVCGAKSTPTSCVGDSTETRTIFTMQWVREDGATPFWRAAQSGDVELMKLLLAHGADPKIASAHKVTPLAVASGIGWVEGITYEWSPEENLEAVKMCLDLGIDPNAADDEGRTALHGAAHKGRNDVIKLLVDRGANLQAHDLGSRDTVNGAMKGLTWIPLHYAEGLVRVGVQSAIPHPETAAYIKKLMTEKGLPIPPDITSSICLTKGINGCQ